MSYTPSPEILEKYAKVLVNVALGGGTGVKEGDVVYLQCPVSALPFYAALSRVLIDSGATTINGLGDDTSGTAKYYYEHASHKQLTRFLSNYYKGMVEEVDHRIAVIADHDVHELGGVDPKKMMLIQKSRQPLQKWFDHKENQGKYTWSLALYGTPSMAKEAGLSLEEYWDQIIKACYLDKKDPLAQWRETTKEVQRVAKNLTDLQIVSLHAIGQDMDLELTLGESRKWLAGGGRNIPSFEVFTSPDWRGTNGWIRFNQPLYYYGPKVEGIKLHFKNGRVVKATASKNQRLLLEMIDTDVGASQLGEYSLTDKRTSHITKFMAETLFDENMGGPFGNTHVALGKSYHDTYTGDTKKMTPALAKKLGFNESAIHTDMISTTDRTVTATLKDGSKKVIYDKGQFTI
jgi:aminopeptidase